MQKIDLLALEFFRDEMNISHGIFGRNKGLCHGKFEKVEKIPKLWSLTKKKVIRIIEG